MWDKETKVLTIAWSSYLLLAVLFGNDLYVIKAMLNIF
jgi:hypothetical protein